MSGQRKALIVANDEYDQEALRNLLAPAADAEALGRVLGDRQIGDFAVQVVRNEPSYVIQAQIEELFSESVPDDVLLLHFSGHGLKDQSGELFFAASNTRPNRLGSTAVSADFVQRCMRAARSRSIVLLLDCCYGGAFAQGVTVRASGDVNVLDSFPQERTGGRGRAVITASTAVEYAFEGNQLADDQHPRPSVFTSALVEGLATGDADRDEDGWVSLNELYDYIFDKVRELNPHQTPSRAVEMQGELYVARSRRRRIRPAPLPPDLQAAVTDPNMYSRLGAVSELAARLTSDNLPTAAGAYEALAELARTDIRAVADTAVAALNQAAVHPEKTELHFGQIEQGSASPRQAVRLLGPPIARACTPRLSDDWMRVNETTEGFDVEIDAASPGNLHGSLRLSGPTGEAAIAISVEILPLGVVVSSGGAVQVRQDDQAAANRPTARAKAAGTADEPQLDIQYRPGADPASGHAGITITSAPLPEALTASLDNPYPAVRMGAVHTLGEWLTGENPAQASAADQKLRQIVDTDIPAVAALARSYLTSPEAADIAGREQQVPAAKSPRPEPGASVAAETSWPGQLAATLIHGTRRANSVEAVTFSPDGRLLASAGEDKTVRLWDPATAQELRTITSYSGAVFSVAFSPDGQLLASAGEDKTVRLSNPLTAQELRTLTGHTGSVRSVAFSPDGQLLASAGEDKTVRLWNPATGQELRTITSHTDWIRSVAFSPHGDLLACAGGEEAVGVWDPATAQELRTLTGHTDRVRSVAFSPDGQLLASAGGDMTVRLWDPATGQELRTLTGHTGLVFSVAFSPDGQLLASASSDKTVRLWDPATGRELRTLTGHTEWVRSVAFGPDSCVLASTGDDKTVRLWR